MRDELQIGRRLEGERNLEFFKLECWRLAKEADWPVDDERELLERRLLAQNLAQHPAHGEGVLVARLAHVSSPGPEVDLEDPQLEDRKSVV